MFLFVEFEKKSAFMLWVGWVTTCLHRGYGSMGDRIGMIKREQCFEYLSG